MKRAKKLVKKKKKKKRSSRSSSGSKEVGSSQTASSSSEVAAMDIFGQTKMAKRVAQKCPGILTATSLAAVQEQLLTTQGQLWDLEQKELPPLFLQFYRGHLRSRMSPAMQREALHVSYCLDLGRQGKIPELLDVMPGKG